MNSWNSCGKMAMHKQAQQTTSSISQRKELNKDGNNLSQEEGNASWMQYPLDDSLTKDFCSDFLYGMPTSESIRMDKLGKDMVGERCVMLGSSEENNTFINPLGGTMMCPSNSETIGSTIPQTGSVKTSEFVKFSCFTKPVKINGEKCRHHPSEKEAISTTQRKVGESSSTVLKLPGNQIQKGPDIGHVLSSGVLAALPEQVEGAQKKIWERDHQTEIHDTTTTVASSTGGSGASSVGRACQQIANSQSHKRKGRERKESESHSEEAEDQSVKRVASCKNLSILRKHEDQSIKVGRDPQISTSTRRNRAAEVHNLSERRRRDRINEKMKALQELIPHCYKTDKASMLDEAIEYLKSLQLQVQIMWMGSGMSPMMFANPQHYMPPMQRGVGQGSVPSICVSSQMPSTPMPNPSVPPVGTANQATTIPSQILNSVNFSNQMRNSTIPDANAHHLGFHNMQIPSEAMDLFSSIQPLSVQLINQTMLTGGNAPNEINPSESNQNDKSG